MMDHGLFPNMIKTVRFAPYRDSAVLIKRQRYAPFTTLIPGTNII